jgi:antirestriction protein ArdC
MAPAVSTSTTKTTEPPARWADLLREAVTIPGTINAAYSAFHNYSLGNQLLALAQCRARQIQPGPIATFNGWREKDRFVRKGERALILCMPVTSPKRASSAAGGDAPDASDAPSAIAEEGGAITRFIYRPRWFVLAQTDGAAFEQPALPGWDKATALAALEIDEIPFDLTDGNVQGYAVPQLREVAISPIAANPAKTLFHELGHALLHTDSEHRDAEHLPRSLKEAEAEAVALLCCEALGLPGAEHARGYIQAWLAGQPSRSTTPNASSARPTGS